MPGISRCPGTPGALAVLAIEGQMLPRAWNKSEQASPDRQPAIDQRNWASFTSRMNMDCKDDGQTSPGWAREILAACTGALTVLPVLVTLGVLAFSPLGAAAPQAAVMAAFVVATIARHSCFRLAGGAGGAGGTGGLTPNGAAPFGRRPSSCLSLTPCSTAVARSGVVVKFCSPWVIVKLARNG